MDRRDLLKATLLGSFLPFGWLKNLTDIEVEKNVAKSPPKVIEETCYYSPFGKVFGTAQKIQLSINYNLDYMYELGHPAYHRYITFPIEAIVDITYERGSERWSGYNPKNHVIQRFSMDRFFSAPFVEDTGPYGGYIELDDVKYRISEVTCFGTKE